MQRLISRQAAAKRNVARRAARKAANLEIEKELQARQQLKAKTSMQALYFKNERERRRQVYEAGNLAPRYDVGEDVVKYATVDPYVMQGVARSWRQYKKDTFPFAEGDRVVITKGQDRGKIGRILTLDEEAGHVKISGLNQGDWFVPEYARLEDSDPRPIVAVSLPIPAAHVKLVYPLRDATTGIPQDTILENVILVGAGWNSRTRKYKRGVRFVPGLREPIPWPKTEDPSEEATHDDDTYRMNVDEITHRPYLLQPPMPPTVIDELRNKYGTFRKRHEDWYIQRKEAEDRAELHKKTLARLVSTPTMELGEKTRRERLAKDSHLTEDQLASIGQVIAHERRNAARTVARGLP